jgi:hypothetical protein
MVSILVPLVCEIVLMYCLRIEAQKWYYIKRQEADEAFILKIYDSNFRAGSGQAEFPPHTGVDNLNGADGPETPRESIEVRVVACYN